MASVHMTIFNLTCLEFRLTVTTCHELAANQVIEKVDGQFPQAWLAD